jgi:hypothetical protein
MAITNCGACSTASPTARSPWRPELFRPLVDSLLHHDEYLLLADYGSYIDCQDQVSLAYADRETWARRSILNTARCGFFSSDRTIREYCEQIWNVQPLPVPKPAAQPASSNIRWTAGFGSSISDADRMVTVGMAPCSRCIRMRKASLSSRPPRPE